MPTDPRAEANWARADNAYQQYLRYISVKPDRVALTFTDLVYLKNFKGGSAVIGESVATSSEKLARYEQSLRACMSAPEFQKTLRNLTDAEYLRARKRIVAFVDLVNSPETDINGFGESFASALLHFYFPSLVPILDRRALNGSGLEGLKVNGQDQVTNLLALYPALIDYFRDRLRSEASLTLRSLDRGLFIEKLRVPPFRKKRNDG